jgi:hypothetical protein
MQACIYRRCACPPAAAPLQDEGSSNANMYGVAVADANTAWAVGSRGIIKRYNGSAWTVERKPEVGASNLRAVAALSSQKAWVGGSECREAAAACRGISLAVVCTTRGLCRMTCAPPCLLPHGHRAKPAFACHI